ncbi:MAG: SgcJ/EcaC family oxidoreductase [Rubrivivax sp.]
MTTTTTLAEAHRILRTVQDAWNAAARHWDAQALAAVYTADALFFGGRPGHAVGTEAIRAYFASYDGVIECAAMTLVEQAVIVLGPEGFLAQGHAEFDFVLTGRGASASRLRTTLLLAGTPQGWKIRQHHFSPVPAQPPLG